MLHANLTENKMLVSAYETSLTIICLNCHSIINIFNIPMIYPEVYVGKTGSHVVDIMPLINILECPHCGISSDDADVDTLFEVDGEIAYDIFKLNMKGYGTLYSCAGHEIKLRKQFGSEFFYCMFRLKNCKNRNILRNIFEIIINSFDVYNSTFPEINMFHPDVCKGSFEALVYIKDKISDRIIKKALLIDNSMIEKCCDFIESNGDMIIRLGINSEIVTKLMTACEEDEVPSLQWYNDIINMGARNALHYIADCLPVVNEYLTEEYMVPDCIPNEVHLDYEEECY